MRKFYLWAALYWAATSGTGLAQSSKNALFLGNSYTYVNDLPQMLSDLALSAGDTLTTAENLIGGQTLQGHSNDPNTAQLIAQGGWDYVVLQEQSQRPSFPIAQVQTDVYPYARGLDSLVNAANPCGETVFYMTWGRKNGDAANCPSWPPVCTYAGMDSLLALRYRAMADDNQALLSPVGQVWHYLRQQHPSLELYQADESHPSLAGSYAAACCFYSIFFQKSPLLISNDYGLAPSDAAAIRMAADTVVFDRLGEWNVGAYSPVADFGSQISGDTVFFSNNSSFADTYSWDFGDGQSSSDAAPVHIYQQAGTYTVTLSASRCGTSQSQTAVLQISSIPSSLQAAPRCTPHLYPNPASELLQIQFSSDEPPQWQVYNLHGQAQLLFYTFHNGLLLLRTGSLKVGMYVLRYRQGQHWQQQTFIKN